MNDKKQITLGELIDLIESSDCYKNLKEYTKKYDREPEVRFDFGTAFPTGASSWRGSYAELAINYKLSGYDGKQFDQITVTKFLNILKDCVGKTFEGWKGGGFMMTESTPLWVANDGNVGDTAVVGIISDEFRIIIETRYCSYFDR